MSGRETSTAPTTATITEVTAKTLGGTVPIPREQRYPLDVAVHDAEMRAIYYESNSDVWDLELVAWPDAGDGLDDDVAFVWSWRAWTAFRDVSSSQALLVRACLERGPSMDLKFVLTTRATERATEAEACARYAHARGGYLAAPPTDALTALLTVAPIRRAIHADVSFDAMMVTDAVVASVEAAVLRATLSSTAEPLAAMLVERRLTSADRAARCGWRHATGLGRVDESLAARIADNLAAVIGGEIVQGVRSPALVDPELGDMEMVLEHVDRAAALGAGTTTVVDERSTVASSLRARIPELAALGVDTAALEAAAQTLDDRNGASR